MSKVRCKMVVTSKADSYNAWDKSVTTVVTMTPAPATEAEEAA